MAESPGNGDATSRMAMKPQPVALQTAVEVIPTDHGLQLIRLMFVGPTGVFFAFFDAAGADRFAGQIMGAVSRARIVLPPAPVIHPNGSRQ